MSKITAYAALTAPLYDDLLLLVDVHDTTMASTGTDKKVTAGNLLAGLAPSNDTTGATDTTNIQNLLTLTGLVRLAAGVFYISSALVMSSGTELAGAGMGATTIRAKSAFSPAQVGSNTGAVMLAASGNTGQAHLTLRDLTFDGNQSTITSVPGYANGPESAPVSIWNTSHVVIRDVEVINAVGYGIYLQGSSDVLVTGCRVLSGAASALGTNQQDGIHLTGCTQCRVQGNSIDTGTGTAGDDGIALQSLGADCTDVAITGNVIRAAQSGIHLAIGGAANIKDVSVAGNVIWAVLADGLRMDTSSTGALTGITIAGNTFRGLPAHAIDLEAQFTGVRIAGNEFDGATNGLANGIYVGHAGSGVSVSDNTFTNYGVANGIVIGPTAGGTAISRWLVAGNVIDMSAGTSAALGILVTDAPDGAVTGNVIAGSTQASSAGIKINGVSTAPIGISVTGNRVKGWATGILEASGGAAPDYNTYFSNNCHGNTTGMTLVGTHDLPLNASTASFNITA